MQRLKLLSCLKTQPFCFGFIFLKLYNYFQYAGNKRKQSVKVWAVDVCIRFTRENRLF